MSDVISDTADPILSAIQGAVEESSEPTEEQTEAATEVESAATTEASTTEAEKPKEENEDEAIKALEAELVSKTPTLQRGRISVSRHQAVLTRNRNKWEEAEKTYQQQLADYKKKYEDDPQFKRKLDLIGLAETSTEKFVGALEQLPQFKAILQQKMEAYAKEHTPAQTQAKVEKIAAEAPPPDVLLADGRTTYSPEQMLEVQKYVIGQMTEKFTAELGKVRDEVKPFVEEKRHTAEMNAAMERMTKVINDARAKLPGFTKYEKQIGELIRKPESIAAGMSLHEAYSLVVPAELEKAAANATTAAEKKAVADLQQRVPKETIRPGSVAAVKADASDKPADTEAIIRAAMKSAGLSAA